MRVLLTNGESAKTLACMRGLAKKKVKVYVTGYSKKAPSFYSKYCEKGFKISKISNENKFLNQIISIIKEEKINVLIPINSEETMFLSKYKNEIEKYCSFPFQPFQLMEEIDDKAKLMKLAQKLKVPAPENYNLKNVQFPCVFKLTTSSSNKGLIYINNKNQLNSAIKNNKKGFILQQKIHGQGCGVSFLYKNGKMLSYFAHKRLREYPITGGPSTYRQGFNDMEIVKLGKKILDHVKWHGLAMVEFKKTKEGYKLIEINPRIWGSINQSILSGVNFPYQLVLIANNKKVKFTGYSTKIKTKLYLNDIRSIISMISKKRYSLFRIFEIFDFRNSDELSIKDLKAFYYYLIYVLKNKK
jgi:predicted ATP-grasp superfamily ATP-dependent carboligase